MSAADSPVSARVSVILPAYNESQLVEQAIDSLLKQTEPEFELIVVDDGSTDPTAAIVSRTSQRVRLIRTEHRGLVAALNSGLDAASCKYVARMDADDLAHIDRLRRQADYLDRHREVGLVASQAEYLGDHDKNRGLALWVDWTNSLLTAEELSLNRFIESPLVHPTVMFRRELIGRFGGYREGPFPEDYELWLRWLEAGVEMAKLPDKLLSWREREGRLTRTDPRYSSEAFYQCKAPFLARWLERHNPHHPSVVVWGAGRASRLRLRPLLKAGIEVKAFVDIDPKKIGWSISGAPVLSPDELPPPEDCFVLQWVGKRGARELIREALETRGFHLGKHYLPCA